MAKQSADSGADIRMTQKTSKKRKHQATDSQQATQHTAFSLLGGSSTDAALDDVFGKSSFYAQAAPAVAAPPTHQPVHQADTLSAATPKRKKSIVADKASAVGIRDRASHAKLPTAVESTNNTAGPSHSPVNTGSRLESSDAESEGDGENLVHESLQPGKSRTSKSKVKSQKYIPPNETAADRDRRTIFIGNLPIEVAKAKSALHQLRAHLLTFAPTAKIESTRFRSVAFATPTAAVPDEDGAAGEKQKGREQERARKWKQEQEALHKGGKAAEEADKTLSFLDAKGKRKVAFIKKDFHDDSATCNAYVVFAHPHPDRSVNVSPIMNPYDAATALLSADGSSFMSRTIRVDTVRLPSSEGLASATTALKKRDAWLPSGTDPKRSLFVGGLDYAAKEEDVRAFFEELVKAERGAKAGGGTWVTGVRLVRDKATQMGKGFGYVHFTDRESADEIIALPSSKLKFAKKPLRVQTSKTLPPTIPSRPAPPSATGKDSRSSTPAQSSSTARPHPKPASKASLPKGDPSLGDRLKSLSKEDRKLAKSADADRAARRLAKKKMRVAARFEEKGAVKLGTGRKVGGERRDVKAKKGRARSDKAIAKMKGSRA